MSGSKGASAISYENYDATSNNYDQTRAPMGIGTILDILKTIGIDPSRSHLLDAGCGTGSYLYALNTSFARLTGLEINPGMLSRARPKLDSFAHIALHQGSIERMPFRNGVFDVVLINQVIHHLDRDPGNAPPVWPVLKSALLEVHRILRPGGVIIINTCSQAQIHDGFWYTELVPDAVARMARRYIPIPDLRALIEEVGFHPGPELSPLHEVFSLQRFSDPSGPFDKAWRDGDSLWALVSEGELEAALSKLRNLIDTGEIVAFQHSREQKRNKIGQAIFVSAIKPVT